MLYLQVPVLYIQDPKLYVQAHMLPRRSPDLNVLDYSLWKEITRKVRKQEASFHHAKKETKEQYRQRLRRAALALSPTVVRRAVGDMKSVWPR